MSDNPTWDLNASTVVGVMCPSQLEAEFSSGRLVFKKEDHPTFLIHRSMQHGFLAGDVLTKDGWEALLLGDEAFLLEKPLRIDRPAVGWVFRDKNSNPWWLDYVAELDALGGKLAFQALPEPGNNLLCLVHLDHPGMIRDKWAAKAHNQAWSVFCANGGKEVLRLAQRANCLASHLNERDLAMLAIAYDLAGMKTDSEGVLAMASNSKGEEFAAKVEETKFRLLAKSKLDQLY